MALPNGLDADLSYESATGRLAGIAHRAGSLDAPIARYDHSYDVRGNLAAVNELAGAKSFTYDAVERLSAVTRTSPAPATEVESDAWDEEGNRVVTHLSPAYVTDAADRVLDDGINTYGWGDDGELTSRVSKSNGQGVYFRNCAKMRSRLHTSPATPAGPLCYAPRNVHTRAPTLLSRLYGNKIPCSLTRQS